LSVAIFVLAILSTVALIAWGWLLSGRGRFWRTDQLLNFPAEPSVRDDWPSVSVIVPARNEARILTDTLPTLLEQDYQGDLHIYLVDDDSSDATAEVARRVATESVMNDRLIICPGKPLPDGWKGKVWAMWQGAEYSRENDPEYLLLTDADIAYTPGVITALVDKALSEELDLVSLMAKLKVKSNWDRLLIPAFVYFFSKLYPFRWVNDPNRDTAGAAGGCILVRRSPLERAGGLRQIAGEIIDDCALGRLMKRSGGRIWMGLTHEVNSTRPYESLSRIWGMVARSAFDQLGYSWLMLLGTVLGMLLLYLIPPIGTVMGAVAAASGENTTASLWLLAAGLLSWVIMSRSYLPMVRWYGSSPFVAPFLSLGAFFYTLMTISSALSSWQGKGGAWKGRTYRGRGKTD
jgi:hopene-associated glycosyltransferase HpnB